MAIIRTARYRFVCAKSLSLLIVMLVLVAANSGFAAETPFELGEFTHEFDPAYYTMKDLADEQVILRTARLIHPDDEYITGTNMHYIVEKVEGNIAWARCQGEIDLSDPPEVLFDHAQGGVSAPFVLQTDNPPLTIGVYHSHGCECYVPSEGTDSAPEGGGVLDVGDSFTKALEHQGLKVRHIRETHAPHDAGAYNRSRRTAEKLLGENADVLFDVHRDAVPASEYIEVVEDKPTVQIQFVVGRQNQNTAVNRGFAESLKKATDKIHPGLIKGIFMAQGNYNQDMLPLSLLLEVGSHENTREGAEKSVTMFADAVNFYFSGPAGLTAQRTGGETALRSVLWIILVVMLAGGAYLIISTGSIEGARARLQHFYQKEFAEFAGRIKRR